MSYLVPRNQLRGCCRMGRRRMGVPMLPLRAPTRALVRVPQSTSVFATTPGAGPGIPFPSAFPPAVAPQPVTGGTWWQNKSGQNWWQKWQQQQQGQAAQVSNPTGAPSTILDYDKYGNPVYSVPPAGQVITGYDAAGNPIWGTPGSTPTSSGPVTSGGVVASYDAYGNPIYTQPPAGLTITGYDAAGNPLYGSAGAAAATIAAAQQGAAAATPAPTTAAPSDSYQSILDWLSESTLISGFPNWGIVAAAGLTFVLLTRGKK
jgi:hypothetical protein